MLNENAYNIFYTAVLEAIEPVLVGPHIVAKAESLPAGVQQVTNDELQKLKGRAKRGRKGSPVPRELGELTRKTVPVVEHIHGFDVHQQDLLASKRSNTPLPTAAARQSARLVAESVEDMIFNGIPELEMQGIYKDAGNTFTSANPWNVDGGDPYKDILDMVSTLTETSQYKPRMMVLDPRAYWALAKTNDHGVSHLKMVEDAAIFPNGRKDIYISPSRANLEGAPIIPSGGGLIGDFDKNIAERYVQSPLGSGVSTDEPYKGEISLVEFPMNSNNHWSFNVQTYQGINLHYTDAFVRLENVAKTPEPKKKGNKR